FHVTGVQTCALPIYFSSSSWAIGLIATPEAIKGMRAQLPQLKTSSNIFRQGPIVKWFYRHKTAKGDSRIYPLTLCHSFPVSRAWHPIGPSWNRGAPA